MGLLRNGSEEAALPIKLRGGSDAATTQRSVWTRGCDVIGPHHFTTAWTEKIPNGDTNNYVLPMKTATPPAPTGISRRLFALMGVGQ